MHNVYFVKYDDAVSDTIRRRGGYRPGHNYGRRAGYSDIFGGKSRI